MSRLPPEYYSPQDPDEEPGPEGRVAFLGLGVMGGPLAGHLAGAGWTVRVYNRTSAKAEAWAGRYGGSWAATPAEAVQDADFVCCCVADDAALRAVASGHSGAFAAMKKGSVFIDHSTVSAHISTELAAAAARRGLDYIDAPVSGGQAGAEEGLLAIMLGGGRDCCERVRPLLECYGNRVVRIGGSGSGQRAKMVNQICIAGVVQGLSEALHFAQRSGLDIKAAMSVIAAGAAGSWQLSNRWRSMADGEFDFGFAVDLMRKDLGLALEEAGRNGSSLPATALVDQFYAEVQALGGGRWDSSSLIARLAARGSENDGKKVGKKSASNP